MYIALVSSQGDVLPYARARSVQIATWSNIFARLRFTPFSPVIRNVFFYISIAVAFGATSASSIYALVGASSTLAGVTQVSVSLVVIMFELTGGLAHLLPTMFVILAAKMVCSIAGMEGIYDVHINIKRYPLLVPKHHVSHDVPARLIMRPPRALIPEIGATVGFLRQMINDYSYYGFPIVRKESDMILTGNIVRKELSYDISRIIEDPRVSNDTVVTLKGEFDITDRDNIYRQSTILCILRYAHIAQHACFKRVPQALSEVLLVIALLVVYSCL